MYKNNTNNCSHTLKKSVQNRLVSDVLGSLQVSELPTSYLLSQATLTETIVRPAIPQ